ncbi:MAG TPA: NPCBM/NEW2 domain-containing protein, partial [bacterium]|nr:NPCBM/NEW2 domain-containing protein [bacterium]
MAQAVEVTKAELSQRDGWVAVKFEGRQSENQLREGLLVIRNYGAVQQNQRDGLPLRIAETTYARGIFTHAVSRIKVLLPSPGKTFSASVGIDTNGSYVGGSSEFCVVVGDEERYRSPVLCRGESALPIGVDLDGAKEFVLAVTDGGDNVNSDQASWADAKVLMENGEEFWLGDALMFTCDDLPLSTTPPFSFNYGGRPSSEFLSQWSVSRDSRKVDEARTEHTLRYSDPVTG